MPLLAFYGPCYNNQTRRIFMTSFKDIKEILREIAEMQREAKEERREEQRKTEESLRKLSKNVDKATENIDKATGHFTNKWGSFMQSLVKGDFDKLLRSRGINVQQTSKAIEVKRKDGSLKWEFDLIAINGQEVVLAEVKTTLNSDDVDGFLFKLADYKNCVESHRDKRIYGAVAYLDEDGTAKYAQRSGLFTIAAAEATNIATITNPESFISQNLLGLAFLLPDKEDFIDNVEEYPIFNVLNLKECPNTWRHITSVSSSLEAFYIRQTRLVAERCNQFIAVLYDLNGAGWGLFANTLEIVAPTDRGFYASVEMLSN